MRASSNEPRPIITYAHDEVLAARDAECGVQLSIAEGCTPNNEYLSVSLAPGQAIGLAIRLATAAFRSRFSS